MIKKINKPTIIEAAGNKPKIKELRTFLDSFATPDII